MDSTTGRIWDRIGALSGILSPILQQIGFMLIAGALPLIQGPDYPSKEALTGKVGVAAGSGAYLGLFLELIGSLLFILFSTRLWATLRRAEGDPAWLSATALGAALVTAAAGLGAMAGEEALVTRAGHGLEVQEAMALIDANRAFFGLFPMFAALFLGATAAVALQTRALPRWLGWGSAVTAAALIVAVPARTAGLRFAFAGFILFILWLLAAGGALMARPILAASRQRGPMAANP